MSAIHIAATRCDVDAMRRELERGVNPNLGVGDTMSLPDDSMRRAPLHYLCETSGPEDRQLECFRALLASGADVNAVDAAGDTPLHCAVRRRNTKIVAALIEAGADVNAEADPENWIYGLGQQTASPLHLAARFGAVECAVLLLEAGAALNERNSRGRNEIEYAIFAENGEDVGPGDPALVLPLLLRAGSELPTTLEGMNTSHHVGPYLRRVIDAGGIANYERGHLASRVATFTPKLAHLLPPELVRRVVAFWMHAGDY